MAKKKHTSNTNTCISKSVTTPDKGRPKNDYADLSPMRRAELALEMATEIAERQSQYTTLSGVIVSHLAPPTPDDDSPEWVAYRLSQLLDESMSDMAQMYRLIRCVTASRDALALKGGAA